ncbi:MAG: lytic transglycosylase domain-containing protein [Myxococcota bacterium]
MRALLVSVLGCLVATASAASEARVPMQVDFAFLRTRLLERAFTDPEQTARVYSDGVDCNRVTLLRPTLDAAGARLRVTSDVDARFGTLVMGLCLFPVSWQGRVASELEPWLDASLPLVHFRVVDSAVLERDGSPAGAASVLWDWVKRYVHPRLELLSLDLAKPVSDLRAVLPLFLSESDATRAQALVDSIALEAVAVGDGFVTVTLRITPPPREAPLPFARPEAPLTPAELLAFEAELARWDGFVTFVVKQAGMSSSEPGVREQLLEVLLDARYRVIELLEAPQSAEPDPVRPLFLSTWQRLSVALHALGASQSGGEALRWLGFVTAADALAALDALGPESGIEISADGLRRLARVVAPEDPADPLATPSDVDPELRRTLGFGAPLPPPELEPEPELVPGEESEPEISAPPPSTSLVPSRLRDLLDPSRWLVGTAHAAPLPEQAVTGLAREQLARLNRWVPKRAELSEYLPLVRTLLRATSTETARAKSLAPTWRKMYGNLQLATAWQETCWRQYVRLGGKIRPLRSSAGAVGLMQVNLRAWRGFYDPRGLTADIAYNGRAGSEILLHYLVDFALAKSEHKRPGGAENLVRATYAAYNGGPRHLTRYRRTNTSKSLRAIDASLFRKYRAVREGRELEVARCFG